MDEKNIIEISNLTKKFRIYHDKANTLKERIIRLGVGKKEVLTILDNIDVNIKKGEILLLIQATNS